VNNLKNKQTPKVILEINVSTPLRIHALKFLQNLVHIFSASIVRNNIVILAN
jgi:hypothetical protein